MVTAGVLPFRENSHGRTGNRNRGLMISSQRLWPLDHEAGLFRLNVASGILHEDLRTVYHWCSFIFDGTAPQWARASSFPRFLDLTQPRTTVGRTPLDEWWTRRRDLYQTTHTTRPTDTHAPGRIRTHNLSRRAAADLRLSPRGQWDRLYHFWRQKFIINSSRSSQ